MEELVDTIFNTSFGRIKSNNTLSIDLGKCVCRIVSNSKRYDVCKPYNQHDDVTGVGTGFLLENDEYELLIVTAHHVIAHHTSINVYFDSVSMGQRFEGKIIGFNPQLDVAFLTLINLDPKELNVLKSLKRFRPGNSDELHQGVEIKLLGYALGQDHMQSSGGGIAGRVTEPNRIQTNAPVNPGNSGGPMYIDGTHFVVGVVTSGIMNAQNINYATPFSEIMNCWNRFVSTKFTSLPIRDSSRCFNCVFSKVSENTLKQNRYPNLTSGIIVSEKHSSSKICLKKDDILLEIENPDDGKMCSVDMQGNIYVPNIWKNTKLNISCLLDRIPCGKNHLNATIMRKGKVGSVSIEPEPNLKEYREKFPDTETIPYIIFGGIVIQMLNEDLLRYIEVGNYFVSNPNIILYSVPMITHMMGGSPFSNLSNSPTGCELIHSIVDERGNEHSVTTLRDLYRRLMDNYEFCSVKLYDGTILTVNRGEVDQFDKNNIATGLYEVLFPNS